VERTSGFWNIGVCVDVRGDIGCFYADRPVWDPGAVVLVVLEPWRSVPFCNCAMGFYKVWKMPSWKKCKRSQYIPGIPFKWGNSHLRLSHLFILLFYCFLRVESICGAMLKWLLLSDCHSSCRGRNGSKVWADDAQHPLTSPTTKGGRRSRLVGLRIVS